jgi:hypothetical protein
VDSEMRDKNSLKFDVQQKIELFNDRVKDLYANIDEWLKPLGFTTEIIETTNSEKLSGSYETYQLIIKNQDRKNIATLNPIGIWIIGAEARVDLVGKSGIEIIVYLSEGGPSISTTISTGNQVEETHSSQVYGFKEEGWHWIDDKRVGKQPKLDNDIFISLLEVVN